MRAPAPIVALLSLALLGCGQATTSTPGPVAADAPPAAESAAPSRAVVAERPRTPQPIAEHARPSPPPLPPPPPPREHGVSGLLGAIAPLLWRDAQTVEDAWYAVKDVREPVEQAKALADSRLERTACSGLVDFRAVAPQRTNAFGYRDHVRGRSWARPVLAAVLVRALDALRAEHPDATVSVGDLSQPGCGQLDHGTLVRVIDDRTPAPRPARGVPAPLEPMGAATALVNQARLIAGVPTVWALQQAREQRAEAWRLPFVDAPVLVEHRLLGRDTVEDEAGRERLRLEVSTRRYEALELADAKLERDLKRLGKRMLSEGALVSERRAKTWDPDEGDRTVWIQRWVLPDAKRQMLIVSDKRLKRSFSLAPLRDVRLGGWHHRKPGSMAKELRWLADRSAPAGQRWTRWQKLYEAGHITHLAGRDADISYVTTNTKRHFAVDLDAIDVPLTWRWFQHLDAAAAELGVQIDRILVDPSIRRLLKRKLPRAAQRSKVWRRIRLARGHDAHHHLRVTKPTGQENAAALRLLEEAPPAPPAAVGN